MVMNSSNAKAFNWSGNTGIPCYQCRILMIEGHVEQKSFCDKTLNILLAVKNVLPDILMNGKICFLSAV